MSGLKFIAGSAIGPLKVRWLWQGILPLGAESLLVGRPSQGKSTFSMWLTARVTRGQLPGDLEGKPQHVIVASMEDHIRAVLLPRFIAADGDRDRVRFVKADGDGSVDITRHLAQLEAEMWSSDAALLIIDPLMAALPAGVDAHRDNAVRATLAPVAALAERRDATVLGIAHFRKDSGGDPLMAVGGSIGIVGAARSQLIFEQDPTTEDEAARVLAHAKSNWGRLQRSQSWRTADLFIDGDDGETIPTSRVEHAGPSDVAAGDLLGQARERAAQRAEAERLLTEHLANGPVRSAAIDGLTEAAGIGRRTLMRARKRLKVQAYQQDREWWLKLPGQNVRVPQDALKAPSGTLNTEDGEKPHSYAESGDSSECHQGFRVPTGDLSTNGHVDEDLEELFARVDEANAWADERAPRNAIYDDDEDGAPWT